MEWAVHLKGRTRDLELMASAFASGEPTVERTAKGEFVLRSATLDQIGKAPDLVGPVANLLTKINGALRATDRHYQSVDQSGHYDRPQVIEIVVNDEVKVTDTLTVTDAVARPETLAVPVALFPASISGGSTAAFPMLGPRDYVSLATSDPDVADMLALLDLDREPNWDDLHRQWEILEADGGTKSIKSRGASQADIDAFGASANNASISGVTEARHSRKYSGRPKNTMTIVEARAFLRDHVQRWLDSKVEQSRDAP